MANSKDFTRTPHLMKGLTPSLSLQIGSETQREASMQLRSNSIARALAAGVLLVGPMMIVNAGPAQAATKCGNSQQYEAPQV